MPPEPPPATPRAARSSPPLPAAFAGGPLAVAATGDGADPPRRLSATSLAAIGLAAYFLALVATLPARLVAPAGSEAAGTAWHGSMTVGPPAAGATARWDASLPASLATGGLAARWALDGPATALTGTARWRPFAGSDLTGVAGRAGWGLLAALAPGLPAGCDLMLDVALDRVAAGDVRGRVTTLPGTCASGTGTRAIPRLIATFAGASGRVAPWTEPAVTAATVVLLPHAIRLEVTAAGAAMLPGFGREGAIEVAL